METKYRIRLKSLRKAAWFSLVTKRELHRFVRSRAFARAIVKGTTIGMVWGLTQDIIEMAWWFVSSSAYYLYLISM